MKKKLIKLPLVFFTVLSLAFFAFQPVNDRLFDITKNLDIFATLYKEVNTYYVDDVNPNKIMREGIDAMLESLDPYTNYIPEDQIEDYRTMMTGQYGGIGAIVGRRNGKNLIIMPYEGFPAHEAGLKIGDEIIKIDGKDVTGDKYTDISRLLKGAANTKLTLDVKRYGYPELLTIELKRQKITIENVPYSGLVAPEVGYIKLSDFTQGAGKEVGEALEALKKDGATKIILDLRGNPGGLLSEAVNVSNIFIEKGKEVVSTKGKVTDWNKTYKALNAPIDTEIPLVVLTSSSSASASEIVSGVVQDYDRGILVGERTFGKGLVQATRPLTYNSQLKITTAKYYIPSGRCIQAIDYSIREDDGSVGKIPDSLKVAFRTANGRTVYDGGGVNPDVHINKPRYAPITASLLSKGFIFDYATEYAFEKKELGASALDYRFSDAEYDEFVRWLSDKDYSYRTQVEADIDVLITHAEKEQYYSDIEEQIVHLRDQIAHYKDRDLVKHRDEIKEFLEEEIVSRYFFTKGKIEATFSEDPYVQEAIQVLNDQERYHALLRPGVE